MDGIRIAAAMAALALGAAPAKNDKMGAAPGPEKKLACKDGTYADRADVHGCDSHGGPGLPEAARQGPARTSQPPDLRAHDTPAHASPYSAFGGKRRPADTSRKGRKKTGVTCADAADPRCKSNAKPGAQEK